MDLSLPPPSEGSAEVATRVTAARRRQTERYDAPGSGRRPLNVDATGADLENYATPDAPGASLIADAAATYKLSARAYHRVLKVARTIADLEGSEKVRRVHIAEALSYRRRPAEEENTARSGALAQ